MGSDAPEVQKKFWDNRTALEKMLMRILAIVVGLIVAGISFAYLRGQSSGAVESDVSNLKTATQLLRESDSKIEQRLVDTDKRLNDTREVQMAILERLKGIEDKQGDILELLKRLQQEKADKRKIGLGVDSGIKVMQAQISK